MPNLVTPEVFLVGYTTADMTGLMNYLRYTGQEDFINDWTDAMVAGISQGEAICSLFAKLCYKSVVPGKNENVSKIRDIESNIKATFDSGHGSVFEHCNLNFIVTNCSRVYTHEQVRHRQGWAYSQTSGRYCRADCIDLVLDPITDPVNREIEIYISGLEKEYVHWCERMGLYGLKGLNSALAYERKPGTWITPSNEELLNEATRLGMRPAKAKPGEETPSFRGMVEQEHTFDRKKKITSALRRPLPNGQGNEIGMSVNVRALRQTVQLRTGGAAEWEIRLIYSKIYDIVREKFPLMFHGAKTRVVEDLPEVYGMKLQPFEIPAGDPAGLGFYDTDALTAELAGRHMAV